MAQSSPIRPTTVDDVTVRLIAGVVLLLGVVVLATGAWWLYALLAVDFAIRAAGYPSRSPLARLAGSVLRPRIAAAPRPTAFAPKRFAAAIGAVLTTAAAALWLAHVLGAGAWAAAVVVGIGVVMLVFPALESILGLCVGCVLFSGLMRLGLIPEEVCVECADISARTRAALAAQQAAKQGAPQAAQPAA